MVKIRYAFYDNTKAAQDSYNRGEYSPIQLGKAEFYKPEFLLCSHKTFIKTTYKDFWCRIIDWF